MSNIMFLGFMCIIGTFLSLGIFNFLLVICNSPDGKTSKIIKNLNKKKMTVISAGSFYDSMINLLSKLFYISEEKQLIIENDLRNADISIRPKLYLAKALVRALKFLLPVPIFLFIFLMTKSQLILSLIFLFMAFICAVVFIKQFFSYKSEYLKIMAIKRKDIEADLPKLVYSIANEINHSHDVLTILEKHKDSMGECFQHELNITVSDMRSGNYEVALQRLESRISSATLSEVVRGLIEMTKGNDTKVYWETLAFRLDEFLKQELRREANKVPAKVQKLSGFVFGFSIAVPVVIVMIYEIVTKIGLFFG